MLGLGESKRAPVGAKEKREAAQKLREAGFFNQGKIGGRGNHRYPSQTIPIAIVYVIATGLAMLLTDQKINPFSGLPRLGIPFYNELVLGGDIGHVTGDPDQDRLFTVLARGGLIFLATGIIPLLAEAAHNSLFNGRVKPFVLCWILAALAPLAYVLVKGHW